MVGGCVFWSGCSGCSGCSGHLNPQLLDVVWCSAVVVAVAVAVVVVVVVVVVV